jgi:uncharacterized protein
MAIRFGWDPANARRNVRRHSVSFEEATTAFDDDFSMTMPDPVHSVGEERFILLGRNRRRLVVVVFTDRDTDIPSIRLMLPVSPTRASVTTMKKVNRKSAPRRQPSVSEADDILPHYDFRGGFGASTRRDTVREPTSWFSSPRSVSKQGALASIELVSHRDSIED